MQERKRVVSLPRYLGYVTRTISLATAKVCLSSASYITLLITLGLLGNTVYAHGRDSDMAFSLWMYTVVFGLITIVLFLLGAAAAEKFDAIEPVEPITRHNIQHLPAEESLVRASQEPTEGQEKILVRAAMATEEAGAEELLRPSS